MHCAGVRDQVLRLVDQVEPFWRGLPPLPLLTFLYSQLRRASLGLLLPCRLLVLLHGPDLDHPGRRSKWRRGEGGVWGCLVGSEDQRQEGEVVRLLGVGPSTSEAGAGGMGSPGGDMSLLLICYLGVCERMVMDRI